MTASSQIRDCANGWKSDEQTPPASQVKVLMHRGTTSKEVGLIWCMPDLGRLPMSVHPPPPLSSYCFRRRSFDSMSYAILMACKIRCYVRRLSCMVSNLCEACMPTFVVLTPYCADASSLAFTSGWYFRARRRYDVLICALLAVGLTCRTW